MEICHQVFPNGADSAAEEPHTCQTKSMDQKGQVNAAAAATPRPTPRGHALKEETTTYSVTESTDSHCVMPTPAARMSSSLDDLRCGSPSNPHGRPTCAAQPQLPESSMIPMSPNAPVFKSMRSRVRRTGCQAETAVSTSVLQANEPRTPATTGQVHGLACLLKSDTGVRSGFLHFAFAQ